MTPYRRSLPRNAPDIGGLSLTWQERAACKGMPQEGVFFGGSSAGDRDTEQGLPGIAICGTCEVRDPCLQYALTIRSEFGVFGGLTTNERKRLLRAMEPSSS